ncbi:LytR/AlgR family response regulator transcription factor [Parvibium lacunae]|uniref:DNA-binding response regulator n=1 Tax=Parvibium lacunae TaxID=1888893 RepID=A0A368L461_9BURK|nr:LytTR family DNA-binding domain-containing protein [Parvibium lacunae]RCS58364.1 DNA-binding response regulator [Parvibium lacunae]
MTTLPPATKPLRLLLVDDEQPALQRLQFMLDDIAVSLPTQVVAAVNTAAAALTCLSQESVDAVLLDIQMPAMNGLELARHILDRWRLQAEPAARGHHPHLPAIIFITAYDQHALTAFDLQALDYLLKPVRAERLLTALQRVQASRMTVVTDQPETASPTSPSELTALQTALQKTIRQHLTIHQRGRFILVPIADVIYFKAELKYVTVRTAQAAYLLEESLTALEEEFQAQFIRIHRNALVAKAAMSGVVKGKLAPLLEGGDHERTSEASWEVILNGVSERLPISRRQWTQVKTLLKQP